MDDFFVRAVVAGVGVALVSAPVGCFIVWRRMAYFGAALAHAALLGVALGFLLSIDLVLAVVAVCVLVGLALFAMQSQRTLSEDTLLGILAHATLAAGLLAISFVESVRMDLMAYLFGDILAVTVWDVLWVWGGGIAVLAGLAGIWRPLLSISIHEELAQIDGVPVTHIRFLFMLLLSIIIAVAMKIVGILLIISLLIIPPAAARRFAATPEQMAGIGALIGSISVGGGLMASLHWDTPAGPSIVVVAALLFFVSLATSGRKAG